jgi:hypothetical protein
MVHMKHLDAYRLFPRSLEAGEDLKTELLTLSLADLDPEPHYQVRPLDPAHVEELKREIRAFGGLFQPVLVTTHPQGDYRYVLLDGHHRVAALRQLEEEEPGRYDTFPAVFLWALNPNAGYAVAAASLLANATAQTLDPELLPLYALRYLARLYGDPKGEVFLPDLEALARLSPLELPLVERALEVSPVDPAPPDLPEPFSRSEFRVLLYVLEASFSGRPWAEVVEAFHRLLPLLWAYPQERERILGLPDPAFEADLTRAARALLKGALPPEAVHRAAGIAELARLAEGATPAPPPPPEEGRREREPKPLVLVIPPFEPKPRGVKRAVRDIGRALAASARLLSAKRLKADPELLEAAADLHRAAVRFLERVAGEEVPREERSPERRERGEDLVESLSPDARKQLVEEIQAEAEGFSYE